MDMDELMVMLRAGGYGTTLSDRSRAVYMLHMRGARLVDIHRPDPDPVHATGPVRRCWGNAQAFVRRDPARYGYVEGVVRRGPGAEWEMHGYVFDRRMGHAIETTTGYSGAVEYQGVALDLSAVDRWFAAHPDYDGDDGRPSLVWLFVWDALERGATSLDLSEIAEDGAGL